MSEESTEVSAFEHHFRNKAWLKKTGKPQIYPYELRNQVSDYEHTSTKQSASSVFSPLMGDYPTVGSLESDTSLAQYYSEYSTAGWGKQDDLWDEIWDKPAPLKTIRRNVGGPNLDPLLAIRMPFALFLSRNLKGQKPPIYRER